MSTTSTTRALSPGSRHSGSSSSNTRDTLRARILELIDTPTPWAVSPSETLVATRDELLLEMARYQAARVEPYARFVASFGKDPREWRTVADVPALPTDVFRFARVSSGPPHPTLDNTIAREFLTSGTTSGARGRHVLYDLSMYDAAAKRAAQQALFSQGPSTLLILAPPERDAPHSSLSYMLSRFVEWFAAPSSAHVWAGEQLDLHALTSRLDHAVQTGTKVALLGTSFAFVHAYDALHARSAPSTRWQLPEGSFIMQTGGFKGRSRELTPDDMFALLGEQYGLTPSRIVAEYGMTELSSQLYEPTLFRPNEPTRGLWAPHWVRVSVVHPDTLREVADGEPGLVRIDDAANLDSVAFLQTADLGRMRHGMLELLGRASDAVPRGCSLGVEELLRPAARP
jgi:hypothetical protein